MYDGVCYTYSYDLLLLLYMIELTHIHMTFRSSAIKLYLYNAKDIFPGKCVHDLHKFVINYLLLNYSSQKQLMYCFD